MTIPDFTPIHPSYIFIFVHILVYTHVYIHASCRSGCEGRERNHGRSQQQASGETQASKQAAACSGMLVRLCWLRCVIISCFLYQQAHTQQQEEQQHSLGPIESKVLRT